MSKQLNHITTDRSDHEIVDAVINARKSVRAFEPTPVPKALILEILEVARRAPSNSNTQPWGLYILEGGPKQKLSFALQEAHHRNDLPPPAHFPDDLPLESKARQTDFGSRYYEALRIDREDIAARSAQTIRNYHFFDAPVGVVVTIDNRLTRHSWADCGIFLQTFMLAAKARGLDTCAQVSFVRFSPVISECLNIPPNQSVVCGMSIGYAAVGSGVNGMQTPRAEIGELATFMGFENE